MDPEELNIKKKGKEWKMIGSGLVWREE